MKKGGKAEQDGINVIDKQLPTVMRPNISTIRKLKKYQNCSF